MVFCAYTFIICHQLTGGLQRRWANKPLKTFTEAMDAFRTAMSFRFFNWLTNNRIGFCLSQREFRLYLGLKIVQVPITIFFRSLVILQVILGLLSQLKNKKTIIVSIFYSL